MSTHTIFFLIFFHSYPKTVKYFRTKGHTLMEIILNIIILGVRVINSTAGRTFAFHMAILGFISDTLCVPMGPSGLIYEHKTRSKP